LIHNNLCENTLKTPFALHGGEPIKHNVNNAQNEIVEIKLDVFAPVTYLLRCRYLLDDFGFCDFARNRTNFPSDSNKCRFLAFRRRSNTIC